MNRNRLFTRYRQFGGFQLLAAYLKLGIGGVLLKQMILMVLRRRSADEVYTEIRWVVNEYLQKKYAGLLLERKRFYEEHLQEQRHSNRVWVCWLQGFEQTPELVKVCVVSMRRYLKDREITLLSYDNYTEYAEMPPHVVERYERGEMPGALFADLLRSELLIRHGGTWMDASMWVTGYSEKDKEIFDADLFMFQALRRDDNTFHGSSNWFITACAGNRPLMVLRDVLTQYWKDYDVTLNYYMFHDFFYTIAQMYPAEIAAMPRRNRLLPLMLLQRLGDDYDEKWMAELKSRCNLHKLNYRVPAEVLANKNNFYHSIVNVNN